MSRRLHVNPVLARELRQRVRSPRASVVLTAFLSLLVASVGLLVWGFERSNTSGSTATQGIGRTLFGSLLFAILGLVCFIVPGVAAGSVAGERERLTLTPLQVTLLTPGQILRGKLLASLAFTTLLLVAALPVLAVPYVLGGVTVEQIAGGLLLVLASAAFLGVVSIWASTVLRRVQRATVVAYGLVGLLVVGTTVAYGLQILATTRPDGDGPTSRWESLVVLAANPFLVTADALGHGSVNDGGASPFTPSQEALRRRDERRRGGAGAGGIQVAPSGMASAAPPAFAPGVPFTAGTTTALGPTPEPTVPAPLPFPVQTTIPFPSPPPDAFPTPFPPGGNGPILPSGGGPVFGPGSGFNPGGPGFLSGRPDGDFTDGGPIWVWTLGWWVLLGGAAYVHALRRLRLPSAAGVRP